MIFFVFPLILLSLFFWIYAENRLGCGYRIVGGVISMVIIAYTANFTALIIPHYESTFYRSSMRLASELISKGEPKRVEQAIQAYNTTATTDSTYRASMEMWSVLNHGPKK
jgi:hypothetical protein